MHLCSRPLWRLQRRSHLYDLPAARFELRVRLQRSGPHPRAVHDHVCPSFCQLNTGRREESRRLQELHWPHGGEDSGASPSGGDATRSTAASLALTHLFEGGDSPVMECHSPSLQPVKNKQAQVHYRVNQVHYRVNQVHYRVNQVHYRVNQVHYRVNQVHYRVNQVHYRVNQVHYRVNQVH
ncbi:hypothetical protein EYF80_058119 [Liparis tanakae]|uniref:Uncharacterized protein n=1 Tax=Liparis tanakae TaxID=230148 RepID=A0A4Z2ESG7_9TELE|nr:hypothetical protein EYF80_058119 [Liparis tanakae]